MSRTQTVHVRGISTLGLLGVAFIVLKLMGYIAWPWLWVTAPFWAPAALVIAVVLAVIVFVLLVVFITELCPWLWRLITKRQPRHAPDTANSHGW